jgi:ribosomal protein S27AE
MDTKNLIPLTAKGAVLLRRAQWRSHQTAHRAILAGELERQPCELCGDTGVIAHHADYTQPLLVTWLCRSCHGRLHAALRKELST